MLREDSSIQAQLPAKHAHADNYSGCELKWSIKWTDSNPKQWYSFSSTCLPWRLGSIRTDSEIIGVLRPVQLTKGWLVWRVCKFLPFPFLLCPHGQNYTISSLVTFQFQILFYTWLYCCRFRWQGLPFWLHSIAACMRCWAWFGNNNEEFHCERDTPFEADFEKHRISRCCGWAHHAREWPRFSNVGSYAASGSRQYGSWHGSVICTANDERLPGKHSHWLEAMNCSDKWFDSIFMKTFESSIVMLWEIPDSRRNSAPIWYLHLALEARMTRPLMGWMGNAMWSTSYRSSHTWTSDLDKTEVRWSLCCLLPLIWPLKCNRLVM